MVTEDVKRTERPSTSGCGFAVRPPAELVLTGSGGAAAARWRRWKMEFEDFRILSGLDKADKVYQLSMFRQAVGEQARDVISTFDYENNEDCTNWEVVMAKLEAHCVGEMNQTYERYQFNSRVQKPNESIEQYIQALKTLAQTCNFCKCMHDDLIADRLVTGVNNTALTKQLLKVPKHTLEE
jgi:hypothetical protein